MVNIQKEKRTLCEKCHTHTWHKVSQSKKNKERRMSQGRRRYSRKQKGFGGQTKPIFKKKSKTTKKIVLKLKCKDCSIEKLKSIKRTRHLFLGASKKIKGEMIQF